MTTEAEFLARLERQELVGAVNEELRMFVREKNGLALWRAYRICRRAGEPIPEVILQYMDGMAEALVVANNAQEVAAAVRMEGRGYGGSARKHLTQAEKTLHIVSQIHRLMTLPGKPLGQNEACRRVAARYGGRFDTVKRMYQRWIQPAPARSESRVEPGRARPATSVFDWGHDRGE